MSVRILTGDALEVLRTLEAESVHCVCTSPPYWGLRCYGVEGQYGLESTPEEHVARMVEVFREVRRVLRADGTAWVNYGDSYAGSSMGGGDQSTRCDGGKTRLGEQRATQAHVKSPCVSGLKPKDLVGMPWRIAFALQADGWWLRSEIIWHKPNPMPESVTDRPTKAHEQVFLLAKSARYFYDADAVREPHARIWDESNGGSWAYGVGDAQRVAERGKAGTHSGDYPLPNPLGRNLRSVWTIATHPFPQAHFATFPPALVEPCIKAGTSEKGCCATCGAPWERVVEIDSHPNFQKAGQKHDGTYYRPNPGGGLANDRREKRDAGWRPTCAHGGEPRPCVVLDPFGGAGTTALVADRLGRDAILIELNPAYARMAEQRIKGDCPLFTEVTRP